MEPETQINGHLFVLRRPAQHRALHQHLLGARGVRRELCAAHTHTRKRPRTRTLTPRCAKLCACFAISCRHRASHLHRSFMSIEIGRSIAVCVLTSAIACACVCVCGSARPSVWAFAQFASTHPHPRTGKIIRWFACVVVVPFILCVGVPALIRPSILSITGAAERNGQSLIMAMPQVCRRLAAFCNWINLIAV